MNEKALNRFRISKNFDAFFQKLKTQTNRLERHRSNFETTMLVLPENRDTAANFKRYKSRNARLLETNARWNDNELKVDRGAAKQFPVSD